MHDESLKAIMPAAFWHFVHEQPEYWHQEAVVLHNPNAKYPLPPAFFGNTPEDIYEDGDLHFMCFGDYIYVSTTQKLLYF